MFDEEEYGSDSSDDDYVPEGKICLSLLSLTECGGSRGPVLTSPFTLTELGV